MLRYNNSSAMTTKPVDYYRPLTVDVSVEYELPKEVAPPKGSAPLLIIHPSAYYRSKGNGVKPNPPSRATPTGPTAPGGIPTNPAARLGDIASTLYYLSTSGLPSTNQNQSTSAQQHIKAGTHHRYGGAGPNESSRVTRSRTAAKTQNCDDYRSRLLSHHQALKFPENGRLGGGVIKKAGQPHQAQQPYQNLTNHNQYSQNELVEGSGGYGGGSGPVPMDSSHSGAQPQGTVPTTTARSTASNKRLRMMSQQQQASSMQMYSSQQPNGLVMMEPLNLALTPTPLPAYNNNQFSTFLGYGLQPMVQGRVVGNSPSALTSSGTNLAYSQPHHQSGGSVTVQSHHFLGAANAQRQLMGGAKEGPVPVDKGSGSDSGVCSENDSDDVSPPMAAAAPFSNSNTTTSQTSRRSNLSSTEFPNAGCYCCCCPSTSTSSGRKGSKGSAKGHQAQTTHPSTAFPSGLSNYGNFFNVIQQQQQLLADGGPVQPHGGSPMDSSAPPPFQAHHQQTVQRKWLGSVTATSLLSEGLNLPGPQMPTAYGKWYQV